MGLLYLQLGDTTRAIQQFETSLKNSPGYSKALLSLGFIKQVDLIFIQIFKKDLLNIFQFFRFKIFNS